MPSIYRSASQGDETLWKDFKGGCRQAFEILYHRYFDLMMQKSMKLHPDKALIEDCVHDLFVEIWNNKHNLALPRSVKAYLLCSVHRKIIRKIKKERNQVGFDNINVKDGATPSVETEIMEAQHKRQQRRKIADALEMLTRRQKEAILLKFYGNLSYPEIADRMMISTASTYNLVSKAVYQIGDKLNRNAMHN